MGELVQHILTFVVLVTVLQGLVTNESYQQYFRFFSGLIVILMLCGPILGLFLGDTDWYQLLQTKIFKEQLQEEMDGLGMVDGRLQDIVQEQCKRVLEEQAVTMAQHRGFVVEEVDVKLAQQEDEVTVAGIVLVVNTDKTGGEETDDEGNIVVERVVVDEVNEVEAASASGNLGSEKGKRLLSTGESAHALKQELSDYFMLQEGEVEIWSR